MNSLKRLLVAAGLVSLALVVPTPPTGAVAPTTVRSEGGGICTSPVWTSSTSGDLYTADGPYLLHNNMWNAEGYDISQTMAVCDHASWYVDDTVAEPTDTAVKTYPNVHVDFHNWSTGYEPPLSSFSKIRSGYAGHGAGIGVYDVAYDIWLNGVASAGSSEVMIWTENRGQRPAGAVVASNVEISDLTWDLWATSSNHYLAFVPAGGEAYPSGTLNLHAFFTYLMRHDRIPTNSTLGQVDYGVEVVSTDGRTARFDCTNFWLETK